MYYFQTEVYVKKQTDAIAENASNDKARHIKVQTNIADQVSIIITNSVEKKLMRLIYIINSFYITEKSNSFFFGIRIRIKV